MIAGAAQLELDAEGPLLGAAVAVEEVVKAPAALRHHLEEELAGPGRRLGDALVEGGEHGVHAVAGAQLGEARVGEPARGHHGAGVAFDQVGQPRVAEEDPVGLLVELALADDAHGRDEEAFVIDLGGVGEMLPARSPPMS